MCTSVKRFAKYGPGKHPTALNTYIFIPKEDFWVTDDSLDDVLFVNCPGTPQWLGVKPAMVFVAVPVLYGTYKQEPVIQIFSSAFAPQ